MSVVTEFLEAFKNRPTKKLLFTGIMTSIVGLYVDTLGTLISDQDKTIHIFGYELAKTSYFYFPLSFLFFYSLALFVEWVRNIAFDTTEDEKELYKLNPRIILFLRENIIGIAKLENKLYSKAGVFWNLVILMLPLSFIYFLIIHYDVKTPQMYILIQHNGYSLSNFVIDVVSLAFFLFVFISIILKIYNSNFFLICETFAKEFSKKHKLTTLIIIILFYSIVFVFLKYMSDFWIFVLITVFLFIYRLYLDKSYYLYSIPLYDENSDNIFLSIYYHKAREQDNISYNLLTDEDKKEIENLIKKYFRFSFSKNKILMRKDFYIMIRNM